MSNQKTEANEGARPPAFAVAHGSVYRPPRALWVRFGNERAIIGLWDFEPFPPEMCEDMGVIKYVRESSPNTKMTEPQGNLR